MVSEMIFWYFDKLVAETLGVASIRPYVRTSVSPSVALFLGNNSLLFLKLYS